MYYFVFLIGGSARGRQRRETQRDGHVRRAWLDADGGRGPEPRNAGGLWKLEKMRKQSLPRSLLKESRLVDTFKEGRVRPISDLSL